MGGSHSLAVKEDKLRAQTVANREDVKEYCDAFYIEYANFTFRPFIKDDLGQTMAKMPGWYEEYHSLLVKNFNLPDNEYDTESSNAVVTEEGIDEEEFDNLLIDIPIIDKLDRPSAFNIGNTVHHQKFGDGVIVAVDGNKLDVLFSKVGDKRVMDAFVTRVS